jgi:hypothetical protein
MKQLSLNPEDSPPPYAGYCKFCDEPIAYIATCDEWPGVTSHKELTRFLCKDHGEKHQANPEVNWIIRKVRSRRARS